MRKSRKVIADVTASPSTPPPQPDVADKPKLACFRCGKGAAKELLIVGQQRIFPAFCSVQCAVEYALACVHTAFVQRCLEHNRWRNSLGKCSDCQERWEKATNLGKPVETPALAVEGEVSNEQ